MKGSAATKALDTYHLILAPTHACNLRCRHCYLPDHHAALLPEQVALRLVDEWSDIVLKERGAFQGIFHVKGGEPFVVPYLGKIMDRLVCLQSLRLMLTTNGTYAGGRVLESLQACNEGLGGHVTVIVSLDGATEETHAILRGKGQFGETLKFVAKLQNYGVKTYLNCVLHQGNIHELRAYLALARDYGASQVNFLSFVPRGLGSAFAQFQVAQGEVYERLQAIFLESDPDTRQVLAGSLPHVKFRETHHGYRTSCECVAAYRGLFYITPNGDAYACPNVVFPEFSVGNVLRQTLRELSDKLRTLHRRLANVNRPYTCAGEKLLYNKTNDLENRLRLTNLEKRLVSEQDSRVDSVPRVSYCYSRNY
jgi:radical SAM protein with 4Fe4S-binding SPASM domain